MKKLNFIFLSFLLLIISATVASADVTLTAESPEWKHYNVNESAEFNFSTPYGVSAVHWYINGQELNYTGLNLSYTFDEPLYYNVSVWAETTAGNSSMLEYYASVSRENATEHLVPYNTSHYDYFVANVTDLNATGIMATSMLPFTDAIGRMFYVVLFGLPFVFMWINQGKLTIPVTLLMIVGSTFIMLVPQTFVGFVAIVVALSWGANLYKLSRGQ